ncbi:MAG: hypothetical protein H6918_05135 [Sphingomonadaceae bacterium]|nr:hypothetical protein [Sphingomonadaceae bacterium]
MARPRNPRTALLRLREQRALLDEKEAKLRLQAAQELGTMLLDCGADTIEPSQLKRLVTCALDRGIEVAIERIAPN